MCERRARAKRRENERATLRIEPAMPLISLGMVWMREALQRRIKGVRRGLME